MNPFFLPGDRFTNVRLTRSEIGIAKPIIDNAVLNINQFRFPTKVIFFRHLE
jgi:hypothetical protein